MPLGSFRWRRTVEQPQPAGGFVAVTLLLAGVSSVALVSFSHLTGWQLSPWTWYLARASGITLYLLLWFSTMLGLGLTTQLFDRGWRHVVYSLHEYTTSLCYGFLALHTIAFAAHPFTSFTMSDMTVPFITGIREPWTGIGVIGGYLMLVIGTSSVIRRLIGFRNWKRIHMLSFPLFVIALVHSAAGGTDTLTPAGTAMYVATGGTVFALTAARFFGGGRRSTLIPARPTRLIDRLNGRT